MRFRNPVVENATFLGGVRRRASFPPGLLAELTKAGNRRGYTRAFHSLVRRWPEWEAARAEYGAIERAVLLLYGQYDWSRPSERDADRSDPRGAIPAPSWTLATSCPWMRPTR